MTIREIIKSFEVFDGQYKREAVDAALAVQAEITPVLLEILKKVANEPGVYSKNDKYHAHVYAVHLLSHFKETKAHDLLVRLFSLPKELPFDLFGDMVTESLPAILYSTCGGSLNKIKEMILNENVNEYCRSGALQAITYAVANEKVSRESVIDFFASFFAENEKRMELGLVYTSLVNACCDIYPEELMPQIERAYEHEFIDELWINLDDIKSALRMGKENTFFYLKEKMAHYLPTDFHRRMSWWACFDQNKSQSVFSKFSSPVKLKIPSKKRSKKKSK